MVYRLCFVCMHACIQGISSSAHMPRNLCGGQRTAFENHSYFLPCMEAENLLLFLPMHCVLEAGQCMDFLILSESHFTVACRITTWILSVYKSK